jgi:hypothetical protein
MGMRALCLFHASLEAGAFIRETLRELVAETCPSDRRIRFPPCSRENAFVELHLQKVASHADMRVMSVRLEQSKAAVELTDAGLEVMLDAVQAWLAGSEDFGVSARNSRVNRKTLGRLDRESPEVWFWGPGYLGP